MAPQLVEKEVYVNMKALEVITGIRPYCNLRLTSISRGRERYAT